MSNARRRARMRGLLQPVLRPSPRAALRYRVHFSLWLALTITVVLIDIVVMWFFFAVAAKSFQRITNTARGQLILNRTFRGLFVTVALLLALVH